MMKAPDYADINHSTEPCEGLNTRALKFFILLGQEMAALETTLHIQLIHQI
jgi:hypothetical protein